jgi:TolB-like protein/DNA-binding winged helix-turn-helix (wHTH) protein
VKLVATPAHTGQTWRFGIFEVDAHRQELCRSGVPVKIREHSFRILVFLLQHPGEIVTREQLREILWPADTFVDFEHGLNTAVMKLREALDDSAETPLYIETIPKRGYRFIAPVSGREVVRPEPTGPARELASAEIGDPPNTVPAAKKKPVFSRFHVLIAAGALLALTVVGGVLLLSPRGLRDRLFARSPKIHALAVLPFSNLSRDPGQEYFSDGMTDAIITELGRFRGLHVISRQSVMQFKGSQKAMRQIARELNVDGIVEGAVERLGDRVRISVHLAQGNPERQLWAQQYNRDIRDVLALEAEIARTVAGEIRVELTPEESHYLATSRPIQPDAYQAYLVGLNAGAKIDHVTPLKAGDVAG